MEGKVWYEVYAILSQYHCCVQQQGLLSSFYDGRRDTCTRESHALLLDRERKTEELFLCLLFLNCFQLKITLTPRWYILGWHIRIPFIRVKWEKSIRPRAFYGSREWNGIESKWVWQQDKGDCNGGRSMSPATGSPVREKDTHPLKIALSSIPPSLLSKQSISKA